MIFMLLIGLIFSAPVFHLPARKKNKMSFTPFDSITDAKANPVSQKVPSETKRVSVVLSSAATSTPPSLMPKTEHKFNIYPTDSSIWYPCPPSMCET
ncbi:hypothetical protein HMI55_003499 [Coelomomyces lativittatus]|nr:hypothetical protein HMI55_003499 [Coelomomyces lativittatus]KAJ1502729.1 hypothetical protein HMI56_002536 [Coelomomyces lativittatus]